MSLISGSNSLTPATAGALDLRAAIVERLILDETVGSSLELCSEYDNLFVRVFPLKQREKDVCCCNCRVAVRLTVLSREDMSDALRGHSVTVGGREESKTIGLTGRGKRSSLGRHLRSRKIVIFEYFRFNFGTRN